jgi:hypothetical protein
VNTPEDQTLSVSELAARAAQGWGAGAWEQALDDWTAIISHPTATADQRAHALTYRGAVCWRLGNLPQARADYNTVLQLPGVAAEYQQKARVGLARCQFALLMASATEKLQQGDTAGAGADYAAALKLDNLHDVDRLSVCQSILDLPAAPAELKDKASRALQRL